MTENPDIIATDDEGNTLTDTKVETNGVVPGSGGGAVDSVFGRTGDITAQDGDYAAAQIANVDLNALFEGLDADKPGAGTAGRYYWATDTKLLYRDDGSTWNVKAGHGTSSDPVPEQHVQSLSADNLSLAGNSISAILEAEAAATREEHGQVSHSDPGTASDGTWDTSSSDTTSVSFSTAFSATPKALSKISGGFDQGGKANVNNQSTTGFDSKFLVFASVASNTATVDWLVIGDE